MNLKRYLILMSIATVLCWLGFVLAVAAFNPQEAGLFGFVLFYLSLFLALLGSFSVLGFLLRVWLTSKPIISQQVLIAFRQGIWFSILAISILILQSQKLLTWLITLLFVLFLAFLESLFIFKEKK